VLVHNYGSYVVRKNARLILAATFSRYSIEVDIAAVQQEIDQLEKELETVQAEMDKYLKELLD
jgi:hypothetical protein